MMKSNWEIYGENEISEAYKGEDVLLILNLGNEEACSMHKSSYQEIGGLVILGNSGAVFDRVNYDKSKDHNSFVDGINSKSFDRLVRELEELLISKEKGK